MINLRKKTHTKYLSSSILIYKYNVGNMYHVTGQARYCRYNNANSLHILLIGSRDLD